MGTKPGVGDQDQAPLSDLGAEMETDALLASLGSPGAGPASGRPQVVVELPSARNATRSAKTRVAGAPVVREEGAPAVELPSPQHSLGTRFAAFGASVTLALVVGVPLVLKIDAPRPSNVAAGTNALSGVVAPSPPPATSAAASVQLAPPPPSASPAALVSAGSPVQASPNAGKLSGKGSVGKPAPSSATTVAAAPTAPGAAPEKPVAPPPAATPATPATPAAPTSTIAHGALVQ